MAPEGPLQIEIVEEAGDWSAVDAGGRVDAVATVLGPVAGDFAPGSAGSVTVVLADDTVVRDLNKRFRGKDAPTNVLSFPGDDEMPAGVAGPGDGAAHLGDVILALETLIREADADAKPVGDHFTHLVLHGILHLLGYDHQTDEEAEAMETLETELLAKLGIADPYADTALAAADN